MFRAAPQVSIQFILDRPSLDVPPPGWTATASMRHLSGLLRITVPARLAPLRADRICIDLHGLTNGVRDNGLVPPTGSAESLSSTGSFSAGDPVPIDMSFVVWQPADVEEYEIGFAAGIHDFPFSIAVPMNILPSYTVKIKEGNPSNVQIIANASSELTQESRTYELSARVIRRGAGRNLFAKCPVIVRHCFPKWQIEDDKGRVGRGATAQGEFLVKLTVPRMAFLEDTYASIFVTLSGGTASVKTITGVKVVLTETVYRKPGKTSVTTSHVGQVMYYPVAQTEEEWETNPIFSEERPLEVVISLKNSSADIVTNRLCVEHAVLLQIEHHVEINAASTSNTSAGTASKRKVILDEQLNVIMPRRQFFSPGSPANKELSRNLGTVAGVATAPNLQRPTNFISTESTSSSNVSSLSNATTMFYHNLQSTSSSSHDDPFANSTALMDASLTVPIRIVHAANPDDDAMIAIAPVVVAHTNAAAHASGSDRARSVAGSTAWASDAASIISKRTAGSASIARWAAQTNYSAPDAFVTAPSSIVPRSLPRDENDDEEVVIHEPVETPYVCLSGYEPTGTCTDGEELRMKVGDHIVVSDVFEDGWAIGTNLNTSTAGFFKPALVSFDRAIVGLADLSAVTPATMTQPIPNPVVVVLPTPDVAPLVTLQPQTHPGQAAPPVDDSEVKKLQMQIEQMRLMMEQMQASLAIAAQQQKTAASNDDPTPMPSGGPTDSEGPKQ